MNRCPYCLEELDEGTPQCSHCDQFIIDPPVQIDYPLIDKKKCVFCGKKILTNAKICKFCHRWLDAVDYAADDFDKVD